MKIMKMKTVADADVQTMRLLVSGLTDSFSSSSYSQVHTKWGRKLDSSESTRQISLLFIGSNKRCPCKDVIHGLRLGSHGLSLDQVPLNWNELT